MKPVVVHLPLGQRSHDVVIGQGLLAAPESWAALPRASLAVIVTNSTVAPLYAQTVKDALLGIVERVAVIELPDGEQHKDWVNLNLVVDRLLEMQADRRTLLVALGGGVVGDLTGFAAACYMRGVPFVQVPTTLLAQVDSSVGGKTAINHPRGKNMIGAFYQPLRVLCDLDTLDTLPARELSAGLAEIIKYGPIADAEFLDWLEIHLDALLARDKTALMHAVRRSCEIKAEVVALDEREAGLREMLNFGHTFGHAIEAGLGYGVWLHGEAIGCGMVLASELSVNLGLMPPAFASRMRTLVRRAGLPVEPPSLGVDRWLELMRVDKKADSGQIRYVLIEQVGKAVTRSVPEAQVRELLAAHGA